MCHAADVNFYDLTSLRGHLDAQAPQELDVVYQESDNNWDPQIANAIGRLAGDAGYIAGPATFGGRAPFFGFMGGGTRYVRITLTCRALEAVEQASGVRGPFLRVWSATYCLDRVKLVHTGNIVSGMTRDATMARAYARMPEGSELAYVETEDFREIWHEDRGFSALADQDVGYDDSIPRFLNVAVGYQWVNGGVEMEKVDDGHAKILDNDMIVEKDPYDKVRSWGWR